MLARRSSGVSGQLRRVAGYRFRATFRRRWPGYLALVGLIGLVGGTALASIAAARRTQSSFPAFLAGTNPADLTFSTYGTGPDSSANDYSARLTSEIAHLPQVRRMSTWVGVFGAPLKSDGSPDLAAFSQVNVAASLSGLYFDMDRATAVAGRMANPDHIDEFVTTALGAHLMGLHVGQQVPTGFYSAAQGSQPGFGTPKVAPLRRVDMKLVGLVVFNNEVVEDDADRLPTNVLYTPALTRSLLGPGTTQGTWYGLQLVHGGRDAPAVERSIIDLLPAGAASFFRVTSIGEARVEHAVKPEALAIAVFGIIAAFATLAVAAQSVSRQLRADTVDLDVLRALGASPVTTATDGVVGLLGAIVLGSFLACAVAVALSPLAPLGPVRNVYPARGIALDWTVLGAGLVVLLGALGALTLALGFREAPHRATLRSRRASTVVHAATSAGLPAPAVVGVRFALEPGQGRAAVPVRSALSGTALAVTMVVATLTFGSGLGTLVTHPALYGWNWSYALNSINNIPPQAVAILNHDPEVAAWAGEQNLTLQIDGLNVPSFLGDSHPALGPPILSGHALDGADQIVLGAATLAALHKHVGDTVTVAYGTPRNAPLDVPPTPLVIVGTATMPAITTSATLADHPSMGVGALVSTAIAPPAFVHVVTNPDPTLNGPGMVLVRLRNGVSPTAGLADLQRIASAANAAFAADPHGQGDTVDVLTVQRPAEIVNYRSTGATPLVLASGLATGALATLCLTLFASVRRRRRDLALLKTLGFTRRQLAATVAWQASTAAVIGIVVGIPLGVALGRQLWILFARQIYAVPRPTVPLSILVVAAGTVALANLVAAVPGRIAARTPAALVLRTE